MPYRKQAARNIKFAYISAFIVIFVLATLAQVVIQVALHRESISRQASTVLASNVLAEQKLQQDDVLLITPGSHVSIVKDMAVQVKQLEYNHVTFIAQFLSTYPAIPQLKYVGASPYSRVITDAGKIIADETHVPALTLQERIKVEFPYVTKLFYDSDSHLVLVVAAEKIVDADTDNYIQLIQRIEIGLYGAVVLTLLYEFFMVIRPAWKHLQNAIEAHQEATAT